MDKYQRYLFTKINDNNNAAYIFATCAPEGEKSQGDKYGMYDEQTNTFTIIQDEDITKTIYDLVISKESCPFIKSVETVKSSIRFEISPAQTEKEIKRNSHSYKETETQFIIKADFNDKINRIILKFTNNIADDFEFNIAYKYADVNAYNLRQEQLKKEQFMQRAAIKHATGESLVNIYFQPCSEDYDHTEITLYVPNKTETKKVGGPSDPVQKTNVLSWTKIMSSAIENGTFFKSINGLAYGRYSYKVKQFDKNSNLLLATDFIEFELTAPIPINPHCGTEFVI